MNEDDVAKESKEQPVFNSPGAGPKAPEPECHIVIAYTKENPEWPVTTLPGGACEANVEVAIAIVLTTLLRSNTAVPVGK